MISKSYANREGRWLTTDLHVHSNYSGGSLTPREILEASQRRFLDAVAITDHFAIQGSKEASDISTQSSFPIGVIAQEISGGDHFHFLLIGSGETLVEFDRKHLTERIAEHHQQGGLTILAHPLTIARNQWAKSCVMELIKAGLLDGIEFFNASILEMSQDSGRIEMVFQEFWEEWVIPYNLAVTGGSDFHHYRNKREIGMGRTYIKVNRFDETGIFEAIRARRCVAGLFTDSAIPFSWAKEGCNALWGYEPWLSELQQLIQTVNHYLSDNYLNKEMRQFFAALLAGGHYQIAYDLINGM